MTKRLMMIGLAMSLLGFMAPVALAQDVLRGHLEAERQIYTGQVMDADTGKPVDGAEVFVPEKDFHTRTGADGHFQVPGAVADRPVIVSIEKAGYAPFALSITQQGSPHFTVTLHHQVQMLVLDKELRHLGDNSFSPVSTGALQFRKTADGPAIRIPFTLNGIAISEPYLEIGSIIGLDTNMVHFLTGSTMTAKATPLVVRLNGQVIAQIQVNGDQKRVVLPKKLLNANGENVLALETGYQITDDNRLDYDDIELMNLVLHP